MIVVVPFVLHNSIIYLSCQVVSNHVILKCTIIVNYATRITEMMVRYAVDTQIIPLLKEQQDLIDHQTWKLTTRNHWLNSILKCMLQKHPLRQDSKSSGQLLYILEDQYLEGQLQRHRNFPVLYGSTIEDKSRMFKHWGRPESYLPLAQKMTWRA